MLVLLKRVLVYLAAVARACSDGRRGVVHIGRELLELLSDVACVHVDGLRALLIQRLRARRLHLRELRVHSRVFGERCAAWL